MPVFSLENVSVLLLSLIAIDFASVSCKIQLVHETENAFTQMIKE